MIDNKTILQKIVHYALLGVLSLFVLIPILWMLSTALKPTSEVVSADIQWVPKHFSIDAFIRMWVDYPFLTYFRNSLIILVLTVFISVFVSALAGYVLSRFDFIGKKLFLIFLLVAQLFPGIMLLVPFYKLFTSMGLINTLLGVALVNIAMSIPFCSWLMYGYFKSIPKELDESATMDGCGRFRTFYQIVVPLTLPGMASTAIYTALRVWNEYMFSRTLLNSEKLKTVSLGIAEFNGFDKVLWNDLMASSIIATIPLILIFIFLQKSFISSLSEGSVKG